MNKILREEMEYLITCDDKAITPDVKDDVEMTLDYIDELEKENERLSVELNTCMIERNNLIDRIDKAIEKIEKDAELIDLEDGYTTCMAVIDILRGKDNE